MKILPAMILLATMLYSINSFAHICHKISTHKDFYVSPLFYNAIMNGTSLDYYTFESRCDTACLFDYFTKQGIAHKLSANNIGIYDANSVGTLTIDNINRGIMTGYLTCSSNAKRQYLTLPTNIDKSKVTLDLQTEDSGIISRTLTFNGYSRSDYLRLKSDILRKSVSHKKIVGFDEYVLSKAPVKKIITIKLSDWSDDGYFMLIMESR